jgi:EmrB/QacA subfamily drug resistance transporter
MAIKHSTGVLIAILTCQLMVILDGTVVNIALPHIQSALGFTSTDLSWVISAYTLAFGGLLLLGARAGDLFGRRRVFLVGIAIFTLASLAAGLTTTSGLLLAARGLQGVGSALASPSALALLTVTFREGYERTRAIASYTAVTVGGSAVGLVVGGLLVQWASWRWIFFINIPIGAALILLGRSVLPETDRHRGAVDVLGAFTSTVGMTALVFGLVRAASTGWGDPITIVAFAAGVGLLTAFVLVERRATTPITPLRLFRSRARSTSLVVRLLLVAAMMGMFFFLSQFLQDVLGFDAFHTGLAFVPLTVVLFASSQLSARFLSAHLPNKVQIVGGLTLSSIGLVSLVRLSPHSSYFVVLAALVLFGFGNGVAFVPLTNMALSGVDQADAGAASGLVNAAQQVGGSLGLAVLVTVFGAAARNKAHELPPGLSASERLAQTFAAGADRAFTVAAGLVIVSLLLVATAKVDNRPAARAGSPADEAGPLEAMGEVDGVEPAGAGTV